MLENDTNVKDFKNVRLRVPSDRALGRVSFLIFSSLVLLICVMTSPNFRLRSVAWSPDGKQIASGSWDNIIKIWDSQSRDCQLTQRRLAISRLQVPNLDGFVDTAAGDLFSIGTPRYRKDPEIVSFFIFSSLVLLIRVLTSRNFRVRSVA